MDAALDGPPVVMGDLVSVTTVIGTRYTMRASDGAIFSRVLAVVTPGTGNGHHGGNGDGGNGENGNSEKVEAMTVAISVPERSGRPSPSPHRE